MRYIGELTTDGYGMMVVPTDLLTEYLAGKKCRARKLIQYLQRNHHLFLELIEKGKLIPFYSIPCFEYHIFAAIDEDAAIPDGFRELCRFEDFYLEAGALGKICLCSFTDLNNDLENIKKNVTDRTEHIRTGAEEIAEPYHFRLGLEIPKGKYEFDLIGLEKIQKTDRESKNYGYAFVFRSSEHALNDNVSKCDNGEDPYKFSLVRD